MRSGGRARSVAAGGDESDPELAGLRIIYRGPKITWAFSTRLV